MGKTKDLGHLAHIVAYNAENHITVPAGITMHTNQLVASQAWVTTALGSYALSSALGSYVPTSRTITINGTTFDLSANRNWDITSMIYPAAGIALSTGSAWGTSITNNSGNWNTAFGWGNHASAGYLTGITSTQVTTALGFTPYNATNPAGYITGISFANVSAKPTTLAGYGITDAVPSARTITINGTAWDLSANRSFTVTASETDTLATVTARGATTTAAITTGVLTVNTGGTGTWGPFVVTSTSQWGDGATQYVTIGAGGAAGIMINNPHVVWNTSEVAAGIKFGRSGGISSGSYYVIGTGASNNFFINKDGAIASPVFNINSAGNATFSGTVTAPTFSGALSGNASTATAAAGSSFLTQTNATWGARMQLGGNGDPGAAASIAVVQATDGNLHMDCGTGKAMYLNYYRNGVIYLNGGTYTISANGSYYNGTSAAANAVAWGNVSSKPSHIMYYQSFTLDANTMDVNATGFTYSVNAPYTGPIVRFSAGGSYDLWLNATYGGGGNSIAFRTRNGDAGAYNPWREIIHTGNIGSQKVDGALKLWAVTHPNDFYITHSWTGAHWFLTSNHGSPVRVGYSDSAGSTGALSVNATANNIYNSGWFRNYGDSGLYNQDYGCHLVRNNESSHGAWSIFGYTKAGYIGMNLRDPQTYNNNLMYENGNGGMYTENANGWQWYYNRGSNCLGLGGSTTYNWVRAVVNGKLKIESDSIHTGWAYFDSNLQLAGGGNTLYNEYNLWYVWRNWGGWGGEWINRNGGDMIMNLYAVYSVTGSISDIRYKKDVTALSYGLNEIMQLNPIKYHYNLPKESMLANDPDYFLGFSAQEVQALIPEAVHEKMGSDNKDGMLAITYDELIPVLVNGMKEQQVMIHNQNIKINKLEALVNQLLNN